MLIRQIAVEEVSLEPNIAGRKHLLRNLLAGLKFATRQCLLVVRSPQREFELSVIIGEHDEPPLCLASTAKPNPVAWARACCDISASLTNAPYRDPRSRST
jgi:hypothetical protein